MAEKYIWLFATMFFVRRLWWFVDYRPPYRLGRTRGGLTFATLFAGSVLSLMKLFESYGL